jgi:hypothetical protein
MFCCGFGDGHLAFSSKSRVVMILSVITRQNQPFRADRRIGADWRSMLELRCPAAER